MPTKSRIFCSALVLFMVGCDEGMPAEEDEMLELDAIDGSSESVEDLAVKPFEDPWEGLTLDEREMLEYEDGLDKESSGRGISQDLAAAPQPVDYQCVFFSTLNHGVRAYGGINNRCSYPVNVRLIWRWAPDGECVRVPAYRPYTEIMARPAYILRVEYC